MSCILCCWKPPKTPPEAAKEESRDESPDVKPLPSTLLPPLKPLDLPKILLEHQFALSDQGWTTITYDGPSDILYQSSEKLLQTSKAFFELPDSYKESFQTPNGSEEGWSRVEGEKEFITLRTLDNTPDELKDVVSGYWRVAGAFLNQLLGYIARSLGLPAEALTVFSEPCIELHSGRTATMLRLFRYEGFEGRQSKIVAESGFGLEFSHWTC
jgi:isopenicillin N synthase-like dioxygenase